MRAHKTFLTAAAVFAFAAVGIAAQSAFHFALSRSAPAADATVQAPEEVRLWFTQAPANNSVAIRVLNAAGTVLPTTEPTADAESPMAFFVKPATTLAAGRYTVAWRGIGDDGHPVTGEFAFAVTAQ
jgi:methionine-rich copper-binding protein CopC